MSADALPEGKGESARATVLGVTVVLPVLPVDSRGDTVEPIRRLAKPLLLVRRQRSGRSPWGVPGTRVPSQAMRCALN